MDKPDYEELVDLFYKDMEELNYDPEDATYDWSYIHQKKKAPKSKFPLNKFLEYKKNIPGISKAY